MTRFTDCLAPRPFLHVLREFLHREHLQLALAFSGRTFRTRRLPAPFARLVLVTGFVSGSFGLPRILGWLGFGSPVGDLSPQAVYQARQRLGWRPIWWLRHHVLDWLTHRRTDPTAFHRGRRLIVVDGTTPTVADTPANERVFDKSRTKTTRAASPRDPPARPRARPGAPVGPGRTAPPRRPRRPTPPACLRAWPARESAPARCARRCGYEFEARWRAWEFPGSQFRGRIRYEWTKVK